MDKFAEEQKFTLNLIETYQCLPALWNTKVEAYSNKEERTRQYNILLKLYKERFPDGTVDALKRKINSLRSAYHREKARIANCSISGTDATASSLYYFKEMRFLDDVEKPTPSRSTTNSNKVNTPKRSRGTDAYNALMEAVAKRLNSPTNIQGDGICNSIQTKLQKIDPLQRILAERCIDSILFKALLGKLDLNMVNIIESNMWDSVTISQLASKFNEEPQSYSVIDHSDSGTSAPQEDSDEDEFLLPNTPPDSFY